MIAILLSVLFIDPCVCNHTGWPPRPLPWKTWADQLIAIHLINMTAELIRDADLKVRHADKIQSQYKNSVTYELGTIAAGIQDKYRHMLEIYRIYSNVTLHMAVNFTIYDSLNAYHVLQSDYNEIKVEQNLFYEVLAKHEGEKRKLEKLRKKQLDKMRGSLGFEGGGGRGRRLGNRKPALWRDGGAFEARNFDFGADWK